jgi:hypothetical protein
MTSDAQSGLQFRHLKRNAHPYIRQSLPRKAFENIKHKTSIRFASTRYVV